MKTINCLKKETTTKSPGYNLIIYTINTLKQSTNLSFLNPHITLNKIASKSELMTDFPELDTPSKCLIWLRTLNN